MDDNLGSVVMIWMMTRDTGMVLPVCDWGVPHSIDPAVLATCWRINADIVTAAMTVASLLNWYKTLGCRVGGCVTPPDRV